MAKTIKVRRSSRRTHEGSTRSPPSSLDRYFQDLRTHDLIEPEREVILGRRIQEGDEEALCELVQANLRFVLTVAKRYQFQGVPLPDLVQEGNLGLVRAAKKFDPERGVKFISYAVWWIRQAIQSSLAKTGRSFRLPSNRLADIHEVLRVQARLTQELGRPPTVRRLTKETGLSEEIVKSLLAASRETLSLDADPSGQDDALALENLVGLDEQDSPYSSLEKSLITEYVAEALNCLDNRQRLILSSYYGLEGEPQTLREIGERLGITQERVRQLKSESLARLRIGSEGKVLRSLK